jgi:hypothetical protein
MPMLARGDNHSELVVPLPSSLISFFDTVDKSVEATYTLAVEKFFENEDILNILKQIKELEEDDNKECYNSECDNEEREKVDSNATVRYCMIGYVYAAWNPLFRDLIKIGFTWSHPLIRIKALSGTGVPEPFQLVSFMKTQDPMGLEKAIHKHFDSVRKYGLKKEFFVLSKEHITEHFRVRSLMGVQDGAGSFTKTQVPDMANVKSFMAGIKLGWRKFEVVGLKLRFMDLILGARSHPDYTVKPEDDISVQDSSDNFVTFPEAAAFICKWFSDRAVAENQIIMLRNLLRRENPEYILKNGKVEPLKKDYELFRHTQIMTIARSRGKVQSFVIEYYATQAPRQQCPSETNSSTNENKEPESNSATKDNDESEASSATEDNEESATSSATGENEESTEGSAKKENEQPAADDTTSNGDKKPAHNECLAGNKRKLSYVEGWDNASKGTLFVLLITYRLDSSHMMCAETREIMLGQEKEMMELRAKERASEREHWDCEIEYLKTKKQLLQDIHVMQNP